MIGKEGVNNTLFHFYRTTREGSSIDRVEIGHYTLPIMFVIGVLFEIYVVDNVIAISALLDLEVGRYLTKGFVLITSVWCVPSSVGGLKGTTMIESTDVAVIRSSAVG